MNNDATKIDLKVIEKILNTAYWHTSTLEKMVDKLPIPDPSKLVIRSEYKAQMQRCLAQSAAISKELYGE